MLKYEPASEALWFFKSSETGTNTHFILPSGTAKFAKFMKHVHSKIGDQIPNTFKLPKVQQNLKHKKKMSLFFPPGLHCDFYFVPEKEGTDKCINERDTAESCCSKTIQQCFLGSMSRGGTTLLLLLLAKKSELFQSTNGRTSKCYNIVFLKLMRGFFH